MCFGFWKALAFCVLNFCEMSRCFPFPPPGYEKKTMTDDVDLLKKGKQKEKQHKKDKKDKEKRENKEKKDKHRSDGKHKDKKDKKEKCKDRKKEKDRDKEKDRSNDSEEKKFPNHSEGQNGEKALDKKKLPGKLEGHSGEKSVRREKGRDKDQSSFSGEKKLGGKFSGYNGEKISQKSHLVEDFRDFKTAQELGRRVRDEGAGDGNKLVDKFMGTDQKRDGGLVAKITNTLVEEKEKNKRSDDRKPDVQRTKEETGSAGNAVVQKLAGTVEARVDRIPRQVENNSERRGEGKEKTKEKGSEDKIRDKGKDKDGEKKSHGKGKDRDKEEERAKAKGEHRELEQGNLEGSNKDDPMVTINPKTSHASKEGNKGDVAEENLRKRKDLDKNGFLHVNDIKLSKFPRTSSSHPLMDDGRTLESSRTPIPLTSDIPEAATILKAENKEHKVNGTIEAQLLSVSLTNQLSASAQASQIDNVSMRPPHPDSKYLSQVLSVPKMEKWSDFDDQEWLFHSNESQSKKPKVGFSEIDEAPQVWAEALQIELADVCALPYVIPF